MLPVSSSFFVLEMRWLCERMNLKLAYCNMTVQRVEFVDMCIRLPAGKIVHIATAEDLIRPDYLNP